MEINLNWWDVEDKIQKLSLYAGLRLPVTTFWSSGIGPDPDPTGEMAYWQVGNATITLISNGERRSTINLRSDDSPVDDVALATWQRLEELLVREFGITPVTEKRRNSLAGYTPEQRDLIDMACIGWAGRGYLPHKNMSEFLQDYYKDTDCYLSIDQFKAALEDAGKRGIIVKEKGRWRLPEINT